MALFPLEEFSTTIPANDPNPVPETSFEEHRLEAYEQGYKAGWDDAAAAQAEEQSRISADFARNLQGLSFTYHEARSHILNSLKPLFTEMVSKVLPKLAQETLPQTIVDEILSVTSTRTEAEIEIVISPANRTALEQLLEGQTTLEISIIEEPTMAEGLAYLRFSDSEKQIDLTSVLTGLTQLVEGFFTQQEKVAING
ncbi:MAG TPA: flagellar biosynthesis protein [Rhodobacteraceae bacterium]|nr:flagellar biosynthesis protein [Paracoccaceae bacterium]